MAHATQPETSLSMAHRETAQEEMLQVVPSAAASALYGIAAEFETPEALLAACAQARDAGYKRMDAYSPMPMENLSEALGIRDPWMPRLMLIGGITGGLTGLVGEWFAQMYSYPLNIGGKGFNAWPQWVVPGFEMTILFSALTGVFGMIILNGLPEPYHAMFNAPNFAKASEDRFFLCIEARDPMFDREETRRFLSGLNAARVSEVER